MSAEPFLLELEVRGFMPWEGSSELLKHVSSAFLRRGTLAGPHDLVLVVDRTNPEGLPGDAGSPHRTNRRPGPFELPMAEVLRRATDVPGSFFAPLRRVTIVEIDDAPMSAADTARLDAYVSPKKGTTLVGAIYVDTAAKTVHTNDGASALVTGLAHADDPAEWARRAYGAPQVEATSAVGVAGGVTLFGPRAVAASTFFFSPLGGASLVAWNLYRTRRGALGLALMAATFVVLCAVVLAPLPGAAGTGIAIGVNVAGIAILLRVTTDLFGEPLRKEAAGRAALLALGTATLAFGGGVVATVGWEVLTMRETTASNGSIVIYDRGTSPEVARRVGETLVQRRVLGGPKSAVRITRVGSTHSLGFAFDNAHVLDDPATKDLYQKLAHDLSVDPFGHDPVRILVESSTGTHVGELKSW